MPALPIRWLDYQLVEIYSVENEGNGKKRLTTGVIDSPVLWLKFRKELYPDLTSKKYRAALRRLCFDQGSGYGLSLLRTDLQSLLRDRITELGKKSWPCFWEPTAEEQSQADDTLPLRTILISFDSAARDVDSAVDVSTESISNMNSGAAKSIVGQIVVEGDFPPFIGGDFDLRPPNAAGAGARVRASTSVDGASVAWAYGRATASDAALSSGDASCSISNGACSDNAVENDLSLLVGGDYTTAPVALRMFDPKSQQHAALASGSGGIGITVSSASDDIGIAVGSASAVGANGGGFSDGASGGSATHDLWDDFRPRVHEGEEEANHDAGNRDNGDENELSTLDMLFANELANDGGTNKDEDTSALVEQFDSLDIVIGKLTATNTVVENQYQVLEKHYTSCFKYPKLIGFAIARKRSAVDYSTPHTYANEQFIRMIGKDVTKEFHQPYTLSGLTRGSALITHITESGGEPWGVHPILNTSFNCFSADETKCICYFDFWGTIELFNDEYFLCIIAPLGENELLRQPGRFRPDITVSTAATAADATFESV